MLERFQSLVYSYFLFGWLFAIFVRCLSSTWTLLELQQLSSQMGAESIFLGGKDKRSGNLFSKLWMYVKDKVKLSMCLTI
jgi:hypothetical protein